MAKLVLEVFRKTGDYYEEAHRIRRGLRPG